MGILNDKYENAIDKQHSIDTLIAKLVVGINRVSPTINESKCGIIPSDLSTLRTILRQNPKQSATLLINRLGLDGGRIGTSKNALCQSIISYSKQRQQLVQIIKTAIADCNSRISTLLTGPNCADHADALTPERCIELLGSWEDIPYIPSARSKYNDEWYDMINQVHSQFKDMVKGLIEVVNNINDPVVIIPIDKMTSIAADVRDQLNAMQKICQDVRNKSFKYIDHDYKLARINALRKRSGLPMKL